MILGAQAWFNLALSGRIFAAIPSTDLIRKKNQLRLVTKWMCEKTPSISPGEKICDDCRKNLPKASVPQSSISDSECDRSLSPPSDEELQFDKSESLMMVNKCLDAIGETPLRMLKTIPNMQKVDHDAKGCDR